MNKNHGMYVPRDELVYAGRILLSVRLAQPGVDLFLNLRVTFKLLPSEMFFQGRFTRI